LATEICSITNQIFEELNIPDILKRGILTPVLKKKKDKTLPGNYRGIVVTNWLTVSNAFSASTVRSSKSRLNFLYININIVSDAINAVNFCKC
jgi:hypothetical protein